MRSVRQPILMLVRIQVAIAAALLVSACAEPPNKEMDQAQGAIDAARAAGADEYAGEQLTAAVTALKQSRDAVTQRDYRSALNYALESRDRAQNAAKQASEQRAAVRGQVERTLADLKALLADMTAAATKADELELASIDREFHGRIFADAGLPALDPILRRCLIHNHRFKISRSMGGRDLLQTAQRHEPIVAAIEARDLKAASAALFHHIATIVDFGPNVFPDQVQ